MLNCEAEKGPGAGTSLLPELEGHYRVVLTPTCLRIPRINLAMPVTASVSIGIPNMQALEYESNTQPWKPAGLSKSMGGRSDGHGRGNRALVEFALDEREAGPMFSNYCTWVRDHRVRKAAAAGSHRRHPYEPLACITVGLAWNLPHQGVVKEFFNPWVPPTTLKFSINLFEVHADELSGWPLEPRPRTS